MLSLSDIIFLVGDVKDKNFQMLRQIVSKNGHCVFTFMVSEDDEKIKSYNKEFFIKCSESIVSVLVPFVMEEIEKTFSLSQLVGLDLVDLKSLAPKNSETKIINIQCNDYEAALSLFETRVHEHSEQVQKSKSILLAMSDNKGALTIDFISNMAGMLNDLASDDARIYFSTTLSEGFDENFKVMLLLTL